MWSVAHYLIFSFSFFKFYTFDFGMKNKSLFSIKTKKILIFFPLLFYKYHFLKEDAVTKTKEDPSI